LGQKQSDAEALLGWQRRCQLMLFFLLSIVCSDCCQYACASAGGYRAGWNAPGAGITAVQKSV